MSDQYAITKREEIWQRHLLRIENSIRIISERQTKLTVKINRLEILHQQNKELRWCLRLLKKRVINNRGNRK